MSDGGPRYVRMVGPVRHWEAQSQIARRLVVGAGLQLGAPCDWEMQLQICGMFSLA